MKRSRSFVARTVGMLACLAIVTVPAVLHQDSTATGDTVGLRLRAGTALPKTAPALASAKVGEPLLTTVRPVVTPPLRDLPVPPAVPGPKTEPTEPFESGSTVSAPTRDAALQQSAAAAGTPTNVGSFDGLTNRDNFVYSSNHYSSRPPDTTGDVGPNHYVEWVNTVLQVYDKSGTPLLPTPKSGEQLFQNLTQPPDPAHQDVCAKGNAGDPLVLYDQFADRWILAQFGFTPAETPPEVPAAAPPAPPYHTCVAVSRTPDPTGAYCAYSFPISATSFNDYPHLGIRPTGYYFTYNMFSGATVGLDGGISWHDRNAMLNCQPALQAVLTKENFPVLALKTGLLPADTDGPNLPPANEPEFFLRRASATTLELFKLNVDPSSPANTFFSGPTTITIPTHSNSVPSIPQKDTNNVLDVISDRLMYRLAYRNWGASPPAGIPPNTESLVVNHTVLANGFAGVRWYEIRNPNGTPTVAHAATYQPDGHHRWMGSAAQDKQGNLMVGYSVSGTDMYPSIRFAGRLLGDPPNELGPEVSMHEGTAPSPIATGTNDTTPSSGDRRWGDYTTLSLDPVDDCTFWFVGEYYLDTTKIPEDDATARRTRWWRTRIGHAKFAGCGSPTAVAVKSFAARWRGARIAVSWRTASESEIAGFNLYRSAGAGPFRRVTHALIAAKQTGRVRGAGYTFVDRSVKRSTTYTYRLQVVGKNGKRTWYGVGSAASR